jgi:hypothetical protein
MKTLIVILSTLFTASAFADIQMICNTKDGYTTAQFNSGIPGTIMTTLKTANSSKDFDKSTLSIQVDELKTVNKVTFETPDENMVSASYTVNEKAAQTNYQIMFYIGGANSADLYKVDANGNQIDGTTTEYTCGMYDDGQY